MPLSRRLRRLRAWWRSRPVREVRLLALLPALIACVMLWPAILNMGVLAPTDIVAYQSIVAGKPPGGLIQIPENPLLGDVIDAFIPWKLYARDELYAGRFPLWNPYNLLGTHFHANIQTAIFSPFNLLWLLLPPLWGLGAITALKWALCGLGMGLFLRRMGLGMAPALFGGVTFQLSGPVTAWLQYPLAEGYLWVPWMLWAVLGRVDGGRTADDGRQTTGDGRTVNILSSAVRRLPSGGAGWLLALSAFVAFEVFAGHVETAFHSLLFVGLFALAASVSAPLARREKWARLGSLAVAGMTGLLLSAVQMGPFLDALFRSFSWADRPHLGAGRVVLPPEALLAWLTPNGFGWPDSWEGPFNWIELNPYVGASTLLLSAWGLGAVLFSARPDGQAGQPLPTRLASTLSPSAPLFWVAMLAVSFSMVYGIPPFHWLTELPGFSTSYNWRLISISGVCVIVLAAQALDRLLKPAHRTLPRGWAFVVTLLLFGAVPFLLGGLGVWTVESHQLAQFTAAWKLWAGAFFCLAAALILMRRLGWLGARTLGFMLVGLIMLDMMKVGWNFNPTAAYNTFYPTNPLLRFAQERGPTERLAVVGLHVPANILMGYRISEYSLYDATMDKRYPIFTRAMSPETYRSRNVQFSSHLILIRPNATLLSMVGIKWLITGGEDPNSWEAGPEGMPIWKSALNNNGYIIWENRFVKPYIYLAERYRLSDEATIVQRLKSLDLTKLDLVQIEDPHAGFPPDVTGNEVLAPLMRGEIVTLESYLPGRIEITASTERSRFLVVNESGLPGWRAEIDGAPAPIYRANYVAQGVVVPPGEHRILFMYDPPVFRWSAILSAFAWAVWLLILLTLVWRRLRGRREQVRERRYS